MGVWELIRTLGDEIDAEKESFLLFSQALPSQGLGFTDPKATTIELEIAGSDVTIQQSPQLLSSNRVAGTTGAVLWRVSPLFANWVASPDNILFRLAVLGKQSTVLELGCGITGVVALALEPRIGRYLATDQDYLLKLLKQNIDENSRCLKSTKLSRSSQRANRRSKTEAKIEVMALDWEEDSLATLPSLLGGSGTVDALFACDCIYNEALIDPFVRTCAEICKFRSWITPEVPTVCIVAQQLRSPDVFELWVTTFYEQFRVWRLPNGLLCSELQSDSGYVVHLGILRNSAKEQTSI